MVGTPIKCARSTRRAGRISAGRCLSGVELVGDLRDRAPIGVAAKHRGLLVWLQLPWRNMEPAGKPLSDGIGGVVAAGRIDKGRVAVYVVGTPAEWVGTPAEWDCLLPLTALPGRHVQQTATGATLKLQ